MHLPGARTNHHQKGYVHTYQVNHIIHERVERRSYIYSVYCLNILSTTKGAVLESTLKGEFQRDGWERDRPTELLTTTNP